MTHDAALLEEAARRFQRNANELEKRRRETDAAAEQAKADRLRALAKTVESRPEQNELLELLGALRDLARGATTQEELDLLTRVDALSERDADVEVQS